MRRIPRGFTLVELLVVIAVIGILATIVFIGVNRYQADSRDAQRSSEANVIANGLEKYYDKNGEYPGCSTMTGSASTVISNVLPGTNPSTLVTPQATSGTTNSINLCTDLTTGTATDSFAYVGDGSTTCLTGSSCLQFKLEYKSESTNSIVSVNSRRSTNITTSGSISGLTATTTDFSAVTLAWNTVSNATYNIQYSINSNFSNASTATSSTNSAIITGLTSGQKYYFEVQPVAPSSTGAWSSPVNATTWSLTTPTVTIGTVGPSSIAISWSTSTYGGGSASSYTAQISTDQSNWTPVSTASTGYTFTGLSVGVKYYFQVQGISGSNTSSWSSTVNATTIVPSPTGVTASVNSPTSITVSWNAVSVATSYTVYYSPSNTYTPVYGVNTGGTGTSIPIGGLTASTTWYFWVTTVDGSAPASAGSSVANATTPAPPAPVCNSSTLNSNTQITVSWSPSAGATSYNMQISGGYIWNTTATSQYASGLNNGTTYTFQVQSLIGSATSAWAACPSATTGVDGPYNYGWSSDGYGVRNSGNGTWMAYPGAGNYYSEGMTIYGSCSAGATVVTRLYQYYAYSNNTGATQASLMDWTWNNQDRFTVGGKNSYKVWWQGWVSCQVGGNRQGDVYLGNAGPYS